MFNSFINLNHGYLNELEVQLLSFITFSVEESLIVPSKNASVKKKIHFLEYSVLKKIELRKFFDAKFLVKNADLSIPSKCKRALRVKIAVEKEIHKKKLKIRYQAGNSLHAAAKAFYRICGRYKVNLGDPEEKIIAVVKEAAYYYADTLKPADKKKARIAIKKIIDESLENYEAICTNIEKNEEEELSKIDAYYNGVYDVSTNYLE